MTRQLPIGFLVFVFLSIAIGCEAPNKPSVHIAKRADKVSRIAVLPFSDAPGAEGNNSGRAVCGWAIELLAKSSKFRLFERSRLRAVLEEHNLQVTDMADPGTAAKVGKLIGVQAVVTGSVSQYDKDKTQVYIHVIPIVSLSYKVGISARVIDVENADVIYSSSSSGESNRNFTEAGQKAVQATLGPLL